MKLLREIGRIIIGLVFIFSGVVKAIDPLGSAYKFHDYFMAFNLGFLDSLSLPLAILLCTAEFTAGFAVITGLRQKAGLWVVMLLMILFTPVTFILALTNPVSDCGCFGDAIHLTNWQTFWKNVVLIILAVILFIDRRNIAAIFKSSTEYVITGLAALMLVFFSLGNLRYLPVIDFLPYKTGVKIADRMVIPEGSEPDKYLTTFIYEKNGEQKEFSLENYPANDTAWKFVDQKSIVVKKGYQPPIHDFSITQLNGGDITQKILSYQGYTLLMVSKKLSEAGSERLSEGYKLSSVFAETGIGFYVLTASSTEDLQKLDNRIVFCSVDETTLKTMLRANPGYMLLRDGVIKAKWSWATLPHKEWFGELASGKIDPDNENGSGMFAVLSLSAAVLLFLTILGINMKRYNS